MKILHLPTSTGGMSWGLAQGEKLHGLHSEVLILYDNWLKYPADRILFKNSPSNFFDKIIHNFLKLKEVFNIYNKYDVFHFNFGTTLIDFTKTGLQLLDLAMYKKSKIVVTYNGCDARQKYPTIKRTNFSACHNNNCYRGMCNNGNFDRIRRKKIKKFDKYAQDIFALNPDLFYFLPKRAKFLPYTIAKWNEIKTLPYKKVSERIKIVHAPTNRESKGSDIIIDTFEKLKKIYKDSVEFILVENVENKKAIEIYQDADLIIDQILIGWYGGFSVEVMKMGKPVMVFIRDEDLQFIPTQMSIECQKAFINVNPFTIYEELCKIIENPELLKEYREAGLEYVYKWHDPFYVASITKTVYES